MNAHRLCLPLVLALPLASLLATASCTSLLGEFQLGNAGDAGASDGTTADVSEPDATGSDAGRDVVTADAPDDTATDTGAQPVDAALMCDAGQLQCGSTCVSATDVHHCGTCANDCSQLPNVSPTGLSCNAGQCVYGCQAGYAHCETDAGSGCDTDISQPGHCGACSAACDGGAPLCAPTGDAGTTFACTLSCPTGETNCGGSCANTQTDPQHCGSNCKSCPTYANGTATCSGGSCGTSCLTGYSACGGTTPCVYDTLVDPNHCGGSCQTCTTGVANAMPTCSSGTCGYACQPTYSACGGGCFLTQTDNNHCGASCSVCTGGTTCVSGGCACSGATPNACNGSCTNVNTDAANCGACGHACMAGTTCSGGLCTALDLVVGGNISFVQSMATDGARVIWVDGTANIVGQVTISTQAQITLASSVPAGSVVLDGTLAVYPFVSGSTPEIGRAPLNSPNSGLVWMSNGGATGHLGDLVPLNGYYYTLMSPNTSPFLASLDVCQTTGCSPLYTTPDESQGVGLAYVPSVKAFFWPEQGQGTIATYVLGGGASGNVVTGLSSPDQIATDGAYLYFIAGSPRSIMRAPVSTTSATATTIVTATNAVNAFAFDAKYLYFGYQCSTANAGLYYTPITGGIPKLLALAKQPNYCSNHVVTAGGIVAWVEADGPSIRAVTTPP